MNRCSRCASSRPALEPNQLERQRVDARQPGELVGGDARQPPEERRRAGRAGCRARPPRRCGSCRAAIRRPATAARRAARPRPARCRPSRSARMCSSSRRRCARLRPRRRGAMDSSAARRRACSSSSSMPSSSTSPGTNGLVLKNSGTSRTRHEGRSSPKCHHVSNLRIHGPLASFRQSPELPVVEQRDPVPLLAQPLDLHQFQTGFPSGSL